MRVSTALVNALSMVAVVLVMGVEAWHRLQSPRSIAGATVSVVAVPPGRFHAARRI